MTFLGNDPWSVPSLEAVRGSGHRVGLVLTRGPRPGRRGSGSIPTAVAQAATRLDLPLTEADTVRTGRGLEALTGSSPEVLVVVAYGEILPPSVLELPTVAAVNVHFSLLPELRGASPVQQALLRGFERTGVTTMLMEEGPDTGPILRQRAEPIRDEDDAGRLGGRLARIGGDLLVASLEDLAEGTARPRPQDASRATFAPKLHPEDRRIDWQVPAEDVVNRVRAFGPEPGALTAFRGAPLKVLRAAASPERGSPGVVVSAGEGGLVVAAARGAVALLQVAPAGKREMSGVAFVRGRRPQLGERLA